VECGDVGELVAFPVEVESGGAYFLVIVVHGVVGGSLFVSGLLKLH